MLSFVGIAEKVKLGEPRATLNVFPLWQDKTKQTDKDTTLKLMSVSVSSVLSCQEGQHPSTLGGRHTVECGAMWLN